MGTSSPQPEPTPPIERTVPLKMAPSCSAGGPRRIKASKNGPRRAAVLLTVHVLIALHVAQWLTTGSTVSPVEPSESMKTFELGEVNAGFVFFAVAILATLVFGRFFCGWGCHIVALQDLCAWIMKKLGVHPKPFRTRLLVYIPVVLAIYMFAWPTIKRELVLPGWAVVIQVFNHQTHHRGQASTLLMQLGVDPGVTDFPWIQMLPGAS